MPTKTEAPNEFVDHKQSALHRRTKDLLKEAKVSLRKSDLGYSPDQIARLASALEEYHQAYPDKATDLAKQSMRLHVFNAILPLSYAIAPVFTRALFDNTPLLKSCYLQDSATERGELYPKTTISDDEIGHLIQQFQLIPASRFEQEVLSDFIKRGEPESVLRVLRNIASTPHVRDRFTQILYDGFSLNARTFDPITIYITNLVERFPVPCFQLSPKEKTIRQALCKIIESEYSSSSEQLEKISLDEIIPENASGYFLGRTFVIYQQNGKRYACKFSKNESDQSDLIREYKMVTALNQHKETLQLKSVLPDSKRCNVVSMTEVRQTFCASKQLENLQVFQELVDQSQESCVVYCYEAPAAYFEYINQVEDDAQCQQGLENGLEDLMILSRLGIYYHQLLTLYHDLPDKSASKKEYSRRPDNGRYFVLQSLLYNVGTFREASPKSFQGAGRMHAFQHACQHPNVRRSGLADLGDCVTVRSMWKLVKPEFKFFVQYGGKDEHKKFRGLGNKSDTALRVNFIAEYFFIFATLQADRLLELERNSHEDWARFKQELEQLFIRSISKSTNTSETEVAKLFKDFSPNMAAQTRFFIQGQELVECVQNNKPFPEYVHGHMLPGKYRVEIGTVVDPYNYPDWLERVHWVKNQGIMENSELGRDLGLPNNNHPCSLLVNEIYLVTFAFLIFNAERSKATEASCHIPAQIWRDKYMHTDPDFPMYYNLSFIVLKQQAKEILAGKKLPCSGSDTVIETYLPLLSPVSRDEYILKFFNNHRDDIGTALCAMGYKNIPLTLCALLGFVSPKYRRALIQRPDCMRIIRNAPLAYQAKFSQLLEKPEQGPEDTTQSIADDTDFSDSNSLKKVESPHTERQKNDLLPPSENEQQKFEQSVVLAHSLEVELGTDIANLVSNYDKWRLKNTKNCIVTFFKYMHTNSQREEQLECLRGAQSASRETQLGLLSEISQAISEERNLFRSELKKQTDCIIKKHKHLQAQDPARESRRLHRL